MNGKKNPHPPTGRQGALTERDSSRLFLRGGRGGGGGIESLSAPPLSSFSLSFRGPPTRTSGLPGALFCLLSTAEEENPPTTTTHQQHHHHHLSPDAQQPSSAQRHDGRARAPPMHPAGIACGAGRRDCIERIQMKFYKDIIQCHSTATGPRGGI